MRAPTTLAVSLAMLVTAGTLALGPWRPVGATPSPATTMTPAITASPTAAATEQPINLAALEQALIDAENRGDVAGTMALFTDDVVFSGGVLCQTTPCIGKAAVQNEIQFEVADHFVITRTRVQVIGTTVTGHIEVQGDIITQAGVRRIALDFTDDTRGDKISAIHLVIDLSDPQTAQFVRSFAPAPAAPPSAGTSGPAPGGDAWITWLAAGAMAFGGVALGLGYFGASHRVR